MHFKADAVSSTARFKCVVMWMPALGCFYRRMKKVFLLLIDGMKRIKEIK